MSVIFERTLQYLLMAGLATLTEEHFAIMQVHLLTRCPLLFEPS
jgi:hypothetical protein